MWFLLSLPLTYILYVNIRLLTLRLLLLLRRLPLLLSTFPHLIIMTDHTDPNILLAPPTQPQLTN